MNVADLQAQQKWLQTISSKFLLSIFLGYMYFIFMVEQTS